jgi:hypothetical protein
MPTKGNYMKLVVELDAETARRLEYIQQYTNQDFALAIQQGIGLYHQQLQKHYQFYIPTASQYTMTNSMADRAIAN